MDQIKELYHSFVQDICQVFPEYKGRLEDEDSLDQRLINIIKNLRLNIVPISDRDESFFDSDPIL